MSWDNTPAKRKRDAQVYGPEYRKNRAIAWRRDGGRCVLCGSRDRCQVDHIIPTTQHGSHAVENLRVLCFSCHSKKTAQEGGGYRASKEARDPDPKPRTRWLSLESRVIAIS